MKLGYNAELEVAFTFDDELSIARAWQRYENTH